MAENAFAWACCAIGIPMVAGPTVKTSIIAMRVSLVVASGSQLYRTLSTSWGMVMATTHFGEYIVRHYPDIPRPAYNLHHTWLEPNFDFEDFGRNPMNVARDQLTFGASLDEVKENTWIAYNGNHHPLIDGSPPPALYCWVAEEEYIDAIDAGYSETAVYTGYTL
jgi:hypothetical protein